MSTAKNLILSIAFCTLFSYELIAAEKCQHDQHWVRGHFRRSFVRHDGTKVSAAKISSHCANNPPSFKKWKERIKDFKPKEWKIPTEGSKPWTIEERERVLSVLSNLPQALELDSIKSIHRSRVSGLYSASPASGQNGSIALYDLAFSDNANLLRILVHECAHQLFRQYSDKETLDYALASEWLMVRNNKGVSVFLPNRNQYVEEDGKESLDEDFSNNIEYFIFAPNVLRTKSSKVYNWISNKYGDKLNLRNIK